MYVRNEKHDKDCVRIGKKKFTKIKENWVNTFCII